jgi:methyl-accepting chemotaxis protein
MIRVFKSIRSKIIFLTFLIIFILQSTTIIFHYYDTQNLIFDSLQKKSVSSAYSFFYETSDKLNNFNSFDDKKSFLKGYINLRSPIVFSELINQIDDLDYIYYIDENCNILSSLNNDYVVNNYIIDKMKTKNSFSYKTKDNLIIFVPFESGSFYLGGLLFYYTNTDFKNQQYNLVVNYILILTFFLIIGFLFSIWFSYEISKPIKELTIASNEIKKGNLNHKIKIDSRDEIGSLAMTYESMRQSLKEQKKEIAKYNSDLEKKVQERTKELESKNSELEQFNKFAINRELKMIELKDKLSEFKKKLENYQNDNKN